MSFCLELRNLEKRYEGRAVVSNVSLRFEPGRVHAILGENGAGKSTLMKLAFGLIQPDGGSIEIDSQPTLFSSPIDAIRIGLGMVQQHFTLVDTLSVIDNIMLGSEVVRGLGSLDRKRACERIEALLPSESLRLDWGAQVERLPVGEKQKVEILKSLYHDSKFLILDEPTAVLSPLEIGELLKVIESIRTSGRTVVMITHKLKEVFAVADRVHVLRQGRLVDQFDLDPGQAYESFHQRAVRAMMGVSETESAASKGQSANSTAPSDEAVDAEGPTVSATAVGPTQVLLKLDSVSTVGTPALTGISFSVCSGEIVGVAGVSGSGQSELVEVISGLRSFEGHIEALGLQVTEGSQVTRELRDRGLSLVPEDRITQGLWADQPAFVNAGLGFEGEFASRGFIDWDRWRKTVEPRMEEFDVRAVSYTTPAKRLSGGNQQKLIFARETLGRTPRLFLIHHPTRGVDLIAMRMIHDSIRRLVRQGVGILFISSEIDELFDLSDRILVMRSGRIVGELKSREHFDLETVGQMMIGGGGNE